LDAGKVGEFEGFSAAVAGLGVAATREASASFRSGERLRAKGSFFSAVGAYRRAGEALGKAYCAAQRPKAGERRAVWCHSAFGVPGMSWDEAVGALARNGINALMPNMLWGGRAYYPSKVLPVDESVANGRDSIAECVAAGKKHGIQIHVWKVNWNLTNADPSFIAQMRTDKRTQVDPGGKDLDWLCPSNDLNFAMERDSMLEVVRKYAVDGIHFDYIRYPGSEGCYCDGCRSRFEAKAGVNVRQWPQDVISGELATDFREFRRGNITRLVKAVSTEARKIRPGIQISAAVFADWPLCRDSVGQDWVNWVKSGYLDFACPMDYTTSAGQYGQWMSLQSAAIGNGKAFCPGVGATLESNLAPDQVVRQILLGRKAGSTGFILFNLNASLLKDVLPYLRMGVAKTP
jgi:uncharacterized lipoprotein YddW (UPF0748 family)